MATVSAAGRDHTHHQSHTSSPDLSLSEHEVVYYFRFRRDAAP